MSFKATLFINEEERTILDTKYLYQYLSDTSGQTTSRLLAKPLQLSLESTSTDSFLYEQMFSPTNLCEGEIVFYKRDGFSTLFKIEFANAYITQVGEHFVSEGIAPMKLKVEISWGIIRMKGIVYEQPWNPFNPFIAQAAPTEIPKEEVLEPKIIDQYWLDSDLETKISETEINKHSLLYIKLKNIEEGEEISIVLEDADDDPTNNIRLKGIINDKGEAILHQ